ncbi:MAG: DegT/DnrJ/EryC1/StrS family aminotransferase [Haloplanus sp.]
MFAVTERLPLTVSAVLQPPAGGPPFPATLRDASAHAAADWFPSARTALRHALVDAGVGPDEEVLLPGYTCHAVDRAVASVATPVYVDVTDGFGMDVDDAARSVTDRTAAVVPTHLYGIPCEMPAIADLAAEHDLTVVEDAAQAVSTLYRSAAVGTHGDYTVCSFRFYKEVTGYKGGLLLSDGLDAAVDGRRGDTSRHKRTRLAAVWLADALLSSLPGRLYAPLRGAVLDPLSRSAGPVEETPPQRLDDWTARLLSAQIASIDERVTARRRNADVYDDCLPDPFRRPPRSDESTVFRYPVLVPEGHRDELCRRLRTRGIGASTMYAYTISPDGECPTADRLAARVLDLPVHAGLDDGDVAAVAETVSDVWESL